MNFFESQDRARKSTGLLVGLFVLAVVSLIVLANLLVMLVFGYIKTMRKEHLRQEQKRWNQAGWYYSRKIKSGFRIWTRPWRNWSNCSLWRNPGC